MATRCFSPPDSVFGFRRNKRAQAEQFDDACFVDEAIPGRAQSLSIEQVRFHVHVRKQQCVLEHVASPAFFRSQVDMVCSVEQEQIVDANVAAHGAGDARDRVDHTALARTRPAEQTQDRRLRGEFDVEMKRAELLLDVNVDHRRATAWSDA